MKTVFVGNSAQMALKNNCIDGIVTSPPYYKLRQYKIASYFPASEFRISPYHDLVHRVAPYYGELGWENHPLDYVGHLIQVFRECKRVLKPHGLVFVNIANTYNGGGLAGSPSPKQCENSGSRAEAKVIKLSGVNRKSIIDVAHLFSEAMLADGWYYRSEIIWAKGQDGEVKSGGTPFPESVQDRPSRAHEFIFMFSKEPLYYSDMFAVRQTINNTGEHNLRDVWIFNNGTYRGEHNATFPPDIPSMCIKMCATEVCAKCGTPLIRNITKKVIYRKRKHNFGKYAGGEDGNSIEQTREGVHLSHNGWEAQCNCNASTKPAIIFDPFAGTCTTGIVATELGRSFVGCEVKESYAKDSRSRLEKSFYQSRFFQ